MFVVNEVTLNEERATGGVPPRVDQWGNYLPPVAWEGYGAERTGQIFHYANGAINVANPEFLWYRSAAGHAGSVGYWDLEIDDQGQEQQVFVPIPVHSTRTVFDCGPFLPSLVTPVDGSAEDDTLWHALHFRHDENRVSRANPYAQGAKFVAGRNASWIPSIVPSHYTYPYGSAHHSRGLGGDFGVLIGLMALSQARGQINRAFGNGGWQNHRWSGTRTAISPAPDSSPRGVIVYTFFEPGLDDDGIDMARSAIYNFESTGIAVNG